MTYARQVELVDLSNKRLSRPLANGYAAASNANPEQNDNQRAETQSKPTPTSASTSHPGFPAAINSAAAQLARVLNGGSFAASPAVAALSTTPSSSLSSSSSPSSFATAVCMAAEAREEMFRKVLWQPVIDVDELRRIVWAHGVPPASWARPLVWKLLTALIPPDRAEWDAVLAAKRARYWSIVHDVTVHPSEQPIDGDHPLNDDASSQWREYFRDSDVRRTIHQDVLRTHADLHRFVPLRDCLERLLFVFAKCHKALGYRQGMNELAATFLLVFSDQRGCDASDVEADAFFCFEHIMEEMATCYVQKESETEGIGRQLRELQALLRIKDAQLESRFEDLGIDTRFYGLRWLRLWFTREFDMPDCLALWDSFLTAEVRLPWLRYVCVAMLIRARSSFLRADFTACMKMLLNYPTCDVSELLRIADRLRTSNAVIVRTARR